MHAGRNSKDLSRPRRAKHTEQRATFQRKKGVVLKKKKKEGLLTSNPPSSSEVTLKHSYEPGGHETKCLCTNVETSKSGGNPNVCKSPWQTQTSPHSCVNPHNHRRRAEFFQLHGAPQQVPIAARSRRCRSHCAQPPSNLEVNPPQTSASMLRFLWFCPPACFPPIFFFSSARCICPICGGLHTTTHESLNLLQFRATAQQSTGKES